MDKVFLTVLRIKKSIGNIGGSPIKIGFTMQWVLEKNHHRPEHKGQNTKGLSTTQRLDSWYSKLNHVTREDHFPKQVK